MGETDSHLWVREEGCDLELTSLDSIVCGFEEMLVEERRRHRPLTEHRVHEARLGVSHRRRRRVPEREWNSRRGLELLAHCGDLCI